MATDVSMEETDEEPLLSFETLPGDAVRSILLLIDAVSLTQMRVCSTDTRAIVDGIAADLLARHMLECRQRAARRRSFLPRGAEPASFVGSVTEHGALCLLGGMACGGSARRRSLHRHSISSSNAWKTASYCGRQVLLVRSDGAVIGNGLGMRGTDVVLECRCDADAHGCDGCEAVEEADPGWTAEEEALIREQEEEAASRGWGWRPREHAASLGLGPPSLPLEAKLLALPEAAVAACACPSRSHVLGLSGAVYSARWHGALASAGPSASPWARCWAPPSAGMRVIEISALSAHVLLRTAAGTAMSYGEPQEGKLGYVRSQDPNPRGPTHSPSSRSPTHCTLPHWRAHVRILFSQVARTVYVSAPRLVDALGPHGTIVGVAAGGRHSLFLTESGQCFTAGANHAGQCGAIPPAEARAPVRRMRLPPDCAPLVQVSAGHAHSLLLSHAGRAYACGLNDRGQCGIEPADGDHGVCVPEPALVSALVPQIVRALEAAPSLSVFEVEEAGSGSGGGGGAASEAEGGGGRDGEGTSRMAGETSAHASAGAAPTEQQSPSAVAAGTAAQQERPLPQQPSVEPARSPTLWLAGHVEAFNIPGTNAQAGGVRFLPSCYRWQLSDGLGSLM